MMGNKARAVKTERAATIADLVHDQANSRKHNPRNIGSIVNTLQNVGAARSIVIDENNVILAGNGMVEAAGEAGITNLKIVEADGSTVIAVRRTGLTAKQKAELAIADNRTAELAEWDAEQLLATISEHAMDLSAIEFTDHEIANLSVKPIDFGAAPESVQKNIAELDEIKRQRRAGNDETASKNDTEKYLVIVFASRQEKEFALDRLGLPRDERYVSAAAVTISGRAVPVTSASGRQVKVADSGKTGQGG